MTIQLKELVLGWFFVTDWWDSIVGVLIEYTGVLGVFLVLPLKRVKFFDMELSSR